MTLPKPMTKPVLPKTPQSIKVLSDLYRLNFTEYTDVQVVRGVIRELEWGQLYQPAKLEDAMRRDDRISGCLMSRTHALSSMPFVPNAKDESARAVEIADIVKEDFYKWLPATDQAELMTHGLLLGAGFAQILWDTDTDDGKWAPRIKIWHPEHFFWDWTARTWMVQTVEGLTPIQAADGQWIIYCPFGEYRPFTRGLMRNLYVPWMLRQWAYRDWGRWSEVYGSPMRVLSTPPWANAEEADRAVQEIAGQGSGSAIRLPVGATGEGDYKLELVEAKSSGADGFDKLIARADNSIAISILGQNLTTEVTGGSYAAASVHEGIRNDIIAGDAMGFGQCMRDQVLRPWAKFNFGDENLAPLPAWNTSPPEDKKEAGDAMDALGKGIASIRTSGARPDVDALMDKFGVPVTEPAEEPEEPAMSPPSGAKAGSGNQAEPPEPDEQASIASQSTKGFIAGQKFVDALGADATRQIGQAVAGDLLKLFSVIDGANDLREMEARLIEAYGQMSDSRMTELLERAMILSDLAGRWASKVDAGG